jgi:membrane-bound ClpP family serine protease
MGEGGSATSRVAFQYPNFRLYQAARFLAIAAAEMQSVAVGWQVYEITKRPLDLGLVGLAQFLPGILLFLVRLGVQAQRQPAVTGESGMLHASGQELTSIAPGGVGRVATHGEIWSATAAESIHAGDPVVVVDVKGLLLTVKRA